MKKAIILRLVIISFVTLSAVTMTAGTISVGQRLVREAELAVEQKDYQKATQLYTRTFSYNDSINGEAALRNATILKDSIQLKELMLRNEEMKSKLFFRIGIGISLFCILMAFVLLFVWRKVKAMKLRKREVTRQIHELEVNTANKSLFVSNMSHEIRTPLNALVGFSDILCTMDMDPESCAQFNDVIQLNSQLLIKLIDDVVDLSTLNLKNMKFRLEPTDAVALCREVVQSIVPIKQTAAEITFQTDLQDMPLNTDSQRLQQVLINIIINATKFCKEGSITLKLEERNGEAYFTVTDTGCGIPLEKQSQVFGRFEKLNEHADGTGLGLSICELIIKYFGGVIGIDPTYTGGTRFYFTHPIASNTKVS